MVRFVAQNPASSKKSLYNHQTIESNKIFKMPRKAATRKTRSSTRSASKAVKKVTKKITKKKTTKKAPAKKKTTTKKATKATKKTITKKASAKKATKKKTTTKKVTKAKATKAKAKPVDKATALKNQVVASIANTPTTGIKYTKFWTKKRQAEFEENLEEIIGYKNYELQMVLTKNSQTKSGNKVSLLTRVVDGMMFGATPMCPECGGGRPKLDLLNGVYYCKGYMDDDEWVYCKKSFDFGDIDRGKWTMDV